MDRYTKGFIVASLFYFFIAAVLGIWMGEASYPEWLRFVHVHFNLLGFMTMMVYGVGYFILPRFNGKPLHWPQWLPIHFYLANIGLHSLLLLPGRATENIRQSAMIHNVDENKILTELNEAIREQN